MLEQAYVKTEAGRAEIKLRALPLSRSARNLLLLLDATRSACGWLAMVNGATQADLDLLASHGLIVSNVASLAAPAALQAQPGQGQGLAYDELYSYLTQNTKRWLGPIKSLRMAHEVARCTDLASLQDVAWRLVAAVDRADGEEAAERVRREMRL